jgi:hypothetical protein
MQDGWTLAVIARIGFTPLTPTPANRCPEDTKPDGDPDDCLVPSSSNGARRYGPFERVGRFEEEKRSKTPLQNGFA